MTYTRLVVLVGALGLMLGGCGGQEGGTGTGAGGSQGSGGMSSPSAHGGSTPSTGTGGTTSTGGALGTGTGGVTSTGGTPGIGGQSATGGAPAIGGTAGGAAATGGGAGSAVAGHTGTGGGGAGSTGGGGYALKNPPVSSAGCGKPATITSSKYPAYRTIMSSGDTRQYVIDMPPNYDMNKPYRIIYASHGSGGEGNDIQREHYYALQTIADAASSVIFISASGLGGIWGLKDVPLFDDILDYVKQNACVDESRVFVLGFSFGGMYSYSLSMTRQKTIRAGIGMSPANYNIHIPPKSHDPIAWMQSTGMSDRTCPWVADDASMKGSKFIAIEHGTDNGCTLPSPIPTWTSGDMVCVDFGGCKPGYPTKVCTFNGGHGLPPGSASWMWDFITQF